MKVLIYQFGLESLSQQFLKWLLKKIYHHSGKIDLSRVGMVGDTLHTDILGANSIGIKSILMTKYGLLKNVNISSLIKKTNIIPDYIIEGP